MPRAKITVVLVSHMEEIVINKIKHWHLRHMHYCIRYRLSRDQTGQLHSQLSTVGVVLFSINTDRQVDYELSF